MRAALLAACAAGAAACTSIGDEKVAGWPELRVVEHYVPHAAMRERCARWGMAPIACAEFDFAALECHLWFSNEYPPSRGVLLHERKHCEGYDHPDETNMADAWERWQRQQLSAAAAEPSGAASQ